MTAEDPLFTPEMHTTVQRVMRKVNKRLQARSAEHSRPLIIAEKKDLLREVASEEGVEITGASF